MQPRLHSALNMLIPNTFVSAILLCGGRGTRLTSSTPKQYLPLHGKPLALYSFSLLASCEAIDEIIVVCDPHYQSLFSSSHVRFALPGERRQDSVYNGLEQITPASHGTHLICIHDSARPCLSLLDLENVLKEAAKHGAATLGIPAKNTIKEGTEEGFVARTLDRSSLWEIHTPQVIEYAILKKGFALALKNHLTVTDDVALAELTHHPIKLVKGSPSNLKVTFLEDLKIAAALL
jgi:2-C-methyl-D-erythritol 4-phosphate cytidylyltransferase